MHTPDITGKILENYDKYDVIIANFANADMVGHTGNFQTSVKAVEVIDGCLQKLVDKVLQDGGVMLVTGDHGNIEKKLSLISGEKVTEHSANPVYLMLIGQGYKLSKPRADEEVMQAKSQVAGILTDIAPTVLEILGLRPGREMTGQSLLNLLWKQREN